MLADDEGKPDDSAGSAAAAGKAKPRKAAVDKVCFPEHFREKVPGTATSCLQIYGTIVHGPLTDPFAVPISGKEAQRKAGRQKSRSKQGTNTGNSWRRRLRICCSPAQEKSQALFESCCEKRLMDVQKLCG